MSIPGRQPVYASSCEGCDTKRYVQHDQVAGRWTIKQIGFCEHGPNSSYLEGTSLHLPLHMTLKLKDYLQGNCPQRALALMREAFPGDRVIGKMSATWIAHWNARRLPRPPVPRQSLRNGSTSWKRSKIDDDSPYCFKESIVDDGSNFLTRLLSPNLFRNARRDRGQDFLSIDGQLSITVESFTMQVLGTCDVAHRLLPIVVCVATSERKAVTAPFLKAVHEEVQKDGSRWCPTKGMADHAGAFRDVLAVEFRGMMVADCYFHVAKVVRDKATLLGSFYCAVMATVQELANLPSLQVHHDKKGAITEWVS